MSHICSTVSGRLLDGVRGYVADESGGATLWNVTWMLVFAGMAGLSIDSSNGYRNISISQSTSDVSALAGAMKLPNPEMEKPFDPATGAYDTTVKAMADAFAQKNMDPGWYGDVLTYDQILIGNWDAEIAKNFDRNVVDPFTPGHAFEQRLVNDMGLYASATDVPVNAVRVYLQQSESLRGNGVGTSLMGLVGLYHWDVSTTATAQIGLDPCLVHGLVAREELSLQANTMEIFGGVCVHGQLAVSVQPNGLWESPDMLTIGKNKPSTLYPWDIQLEQYEWLGPGQKGDPIGDQMQDPHELDRYPAMVDQIVEIGWSTMAGVLGYRHFSHPQSLPLYDDTTQPEVVRLPNGFSEITGTDPGDGTQTWWRVGGPTQVASLDGFGALAALLGLSQTSTPSSNSMVIDYHPTYRYGAHTQSGNQSSSITWPANTSQIDIDAVVNGRSVLWTDDPTKGAPTSKTATLLENKIYFADVCQSGKLNLTGHIKNVTIITNCKIDIAGTAIIENAMLLSTATGQQAVQVSNGARFGSVCNDWGNVRVFSNGDIKTVSGNAADSIFYGAQLVARENIEFSAQGDIHQGISMLAGGDLTITPKAQLGSISDGASQTGCPVDGLEFEYDQWAYTHALVD